ncbi:HAMP domain-containing protein [candidate division GN15 bacterium]|nr:HAMP domain-containing protein [candidate division GN15 bacterium]
MRTDVKSEFGQKLFRLFILFSLVPAAVLALVGYYLVTNASAPAAVNTGAGGAAVAEYYNEYLFTQLENADTTAASVDFIMHLVDGEVTMPRGAEELDAAATAHVVAAARHRSHGFVEAGRRVYQYQRQVTGSDTTVVGYIHGPRFAELSRSVRAEIPGEAGREAIQSRYSLFLGGLFLLLALITVSVALVLSRRMAHNLARPLAELSDAASSIAEGNFRTRVPPQGESDIRNLIERFNDMTEQLERTTTRLTATERVAAWRQVARRFAHELKNPLQPILVSLYRIERLLIDTAQYDKVYEPLKAASDEVRHLKQLAERFSHLAKLPPPSMETTDACELVRTVAELYQGPDLPYVVETDLPDHVCMLPVDPAYLREALHNLIQNGLDATDRTGTVTVSLHENGEFVEIAVRDDGPGMDDETIRSARLPYFTTKPEGHGLGLAIVEKSVGELHGRLDIESTSDEGTTVTISLPKGP